MDSSLALLWIYTRTQIFRLMHLIPFIRFDHRVTRSPRQIIKLCGTRVARRSVEIIKRITL